MLPPNYSHGNTINLVSSIFKGFGLSNNYNDIQQLTEEIKTTKNVVLLVLDGLGYDSLKQLGRDSFLNKNLQQQLETIYPPTTTAVITAFLTGLTPKEHGLIFWDIMLEEMGGVVQVLPGKFKGGEGVHFTQAKLKIPKSIFQKIKVDSHFVIKKSLLKSHFNQALSGKETAWPINNFEGLLRSIRKIIHLPNRKYIYAYWGEFDSVSHQYGKDDKKSLDHLKRLNELIEKFTKRIVGTDTLLLITADHGQIITGKKKAVILNHHPLLTECLSAPTCGESRAAVCYVHPHKTQQFEKYVKHKLSKYCKLYRSSELIDNNYFGMGKPHPMLQHRVGNYILIAEKNYTLKYFLPNEEEQFLKGNHGGASQEEMTVPLIKIKL